MNFMDPRRVLLPGILLGFIYYGPPTFAAMWNLWWTVLQ